MPLIPCVEGKKLDYVESADVPVKYGIMNLKFESMEEKKRARMARFVKESTISKAI